MERVVKTNTKRLAEQEVPLTKRTLVSATKKAFKEAAAETMEVMGYNVVAENGQVFKVFADGQKEIIGEVPNRKKFTPAQIRKAFES